MLDDNLLGQVHHTDYNDLALSLADGSIDMLFLDPTYTIEYRSNYYKGGNPHAPMQGD